MKKHKGQHVLSKMAKIFNVSCSGYYAWKHRKMSKQEEKDNKLSEQIKQIFTKHFRRYGSPRIWQELKAQGVRISRKRVERLMMEQNLKARPSNKWVKTTDSNHDFPITENILNREFYAEQGGEKWVSDITYLRSANGWLYLTIILDLWDRKVIGWSMSNNLTSQPVCAAFEMAVRNRPPCKNLIFHSDRGVQYCSNDFRKTLKRLCPTVRQSMSRKGNCWDNACAESFFKTLKSELNILKGGYISSQVKTAVFEYIEIYYNRCRRHSAIGYAIPIAVTNNFVA